MIFKYEIKVYADQVEMQDKQQKLIYSSIEVVYGDIVLKLKKVLVEEEWNDIIFDSNQNFIYARADTVGEGHGSNKGKSVINLSLGVTFKVYDPNQGNRLARGILVGLAWIFWYSCLLGLICCDISSLLFPIDAISMITVTVLTFSLT